MAKIPTCALTLAMYLLLNVRHLTVASSTTQHQFNNTSNSTEATVGQSTTAITQHHEASTDSSRRERLGNSDTNNTSDAMNTTLTTISQGSVGSLPTVLPTNNGTDNMTSATRLAPGGDTPHANQTTNSMMTMTTVTEITAKPKDSGFPRNGIIILCVVIGLLLITLLYCFFQRRKKGRNSFHLRRGSPDNVEIPLSSGVAEKNAALNMKEDKIDIHPIQPPENTSAMEYSPKQAAASGTADGHEGESSSTASTVPKDEELDKLSLDSSRASLLPHSTALKEQDQAGDGNAGAPTESHIKELNENNNNSSQWAILQLKSRGRAEEPYHASPASAVTTRNHGERLPQMERATLMQADFEEDQRRCAGDIAQKNSFCDILLNLEP